MVALLKMPKSFLPLTDAQGADRRLWQRRDVVTQVQGTRLDHTLPARQQPQLSLSLRDLSLGGLSGLSDKPLETGERVAVRFPPQGLGTGGWDAAGRVIRCSQSAMGYRIAIEFDPLPQAA